MIEKYGVNLFEGHEREIGKMLSSDHHRSVLEEMSNAFPVLRIVPQKNLKSRRPTC